MVLHMEVSLGHYADLAVGLPLSVTLSRCLEVVRPLTAQPVVSSMTREHYLEVKHHITLVTHTSIVVVAAHWHLMTTWDKIDYQALGELGVDLFQHGAEREVERFAVA